MLTSRTALRSAAIGALVTAAGVLLSGPVSFGVVELLRPQPAWSGADRFVASYHPLQTLPFFGGFVLIAGFVLLISSLHASAPPSLRARTTAAVVTVSAFTALVVFNYLVQTTFVPQLVAHYRPSDEPIVSTFAMANPASLAWCIEMWAYALLGVATWLVAPMFGGDRVGRATAWCFVANGPISVGTAVLTALAPAWAMTTPGLAAYLAWNVLVFVMVILAAISLRRRIAKR